jgi:hypothetical protein
MARNRIDRESFFVVSLEQLPRGRHNSRSARFD